MLKRFGAALALLFAVPVFADDYLESVAVSTTSAATATSRVGGIWYAAQCDVATRWRACVGSTCTSTANDELIIANQVFDIYLPSDRHYFGFKTDAGTGTCRVYFALYQRAVP